MTTNLEKAKSLHLEISYCQVMQTTYGSHYEDFLEQARSLRAIIIGVSMMKRSKTKDDEEAVKILDALLGADE